jgi:hypothetical protein
MLGVPSVDRAVWLAPVEVVRRAQLHDRGAPAAVQAQYRNKALVRDQRDVDADDWQALYDVTGERDGSRDSRPWSTSSSSPTSMIRNLIRESFCGLSSP